MIAKIWIKISSVRFNNKVFTIKDIWCWFSIPNLLTLYICIPVAYVKTNITFSLFVRNISKIISILLNSWMYYWGKIISLLLIHTYFGVIWYYLIYQIKLLYFAHVQTNTHKTRRLILHYVAVDDLIMSYHLTKEYLWLCMF